MSIKLKDLQLAEVDILKEFVRICNAHALTYYIVGGTLLGAVRDKKFIPWDDDIDVAMPRKDYEELAKIASNELKTGFFYQDSSTDPYYYLSYAKIRKEGTLFFEERFRNSKFRNGIFIDIFPLDKCPRRGILSRLLFDILAVMNYRGQVDSGESYRPYEELVGKWGYSLLKLCPPARLPSLRKKILRVGSWFSDGSQLASYSGAYGYHREVFPQEWFGEPRNIEFEKIIVSAPHETELLLTQLYGEYNQLPPISQRACHADLERSYMENSKLQNEK